MINRIIIKHLFYLSFYFWKTFSSAKKCDYVQTFKEHLKFYENTEELSHYIPRQSCFICVKPSCEHRHLKCDTNEFSDLPFYHNMLEFGFLGNDLPLQAHVRVPLSQKCYFLIEMNTHLGPEVDFSFWQCLYSNHDCSSYHSIPFESIKESDCVFLSVMLNRKFYNKIYVSVSLDCINLASAIRTNKTHQTIAKKECYFKGFNQALENFPTVHFKLFVRSDSRNVGSVLVVPCSPGGYIVSPINGRYVYDYHCKTLFFPEVHGDSPEEIILLQHNYGEHVQFPIKEGPHDYSEEGLRPIYISKDGCPLPPSEMLPKQKTYDNGKKPSIFRDRCDLYKKLPYDSIEEAINSSHVLSTKRLDPTAPAIVFIKTTKIPTESKSEKQTTPKTNIKSAPTTKSKVSTSTKEGTTEIPLIPPGVTLPETEQIKEKVIVSDVNGSSSTFFSFKSRKGVFSKILTLAPGEKPPPTPKILLWIPDYEDLLEARKQHGKRKEKKVKFSRHHTPTVQTRKKPEKKIDKIFERFDKDKIKKGIDYFYSINVDEDYSNGSNMKKLMDSWFYIFLFFWLYEKIFLLILKCPSN